MNTRPRRLKRSPRSQVSALYNSRYIFSSRRNFALSLPSPTTRLRLNPTFPVHAQPTYRRNRTWAIPPNPTPTDTTCPTLAAVYACPSPISALGRSVLCCCKTLLSSYRLPIGKLSNLPADLHMPELSARSTELRIPFRETPVDVTRCHSFPTHA
ncbi:hypothetical protein RRG08_002619 [Elysia crispata]|uniref:Uncharacterized protein n=1 Tax=Elysia crispata TaxID=231223 RepID=A0AAE0Y4P5_9GAST|nr:hypothetical protein RRG08_002619 [Elysia crispata]